MKYKHKQTGQIVTKGTDGLFHSQNGGYTLQRWIFENSSDWEEIKEEPNYLITAFRFKDNSTIWDLKSDGSYGATPIISKYTLKEMLKGGISVETGSVEIYSVKNSKGEEFTIGDKFNVGGGKNNYNFEVLSFCIENNKIVIRINVDGIKDKIWLDDACKIKSPIYTTTDGVEVFEGDRVWLFLINKDLTIPYANEVSVNRFNNAEKEVADRYLTFTSEENRDKYIKEHTRKPIFVSADGKEMFIGDKYYVPQINFNKELIGSYLELETNKETTSDGVKRFSNKLAAQEYIDNNKPKYSLSDIENCYPHANITGNRIKDIPVVAALFSNLKRLGK